MKFLKKTADSPILREGLTYRLEGGHNERLRQMLLEEQQGFCAYTEKYVDDGIDSCDIEHFDPSKKHAGDDYYNYYAVLSSANHRKRAKEKKHEGAEFFRSRFFQDEKQFSERVRFVAEDGVYEAVEGDQEAAALIDYLGLNDNCLYGARWNHIHRLQDLFKGYSRKQRLEFLSKHRSELSYITALEAVLELDLSALLST